MDGFAMARFTIERDLAFLLSDTARLLRTCADQKARQFGMTRAKWAVLFRLERAEGLKQAELADILEVQPITLTRLIDRLCESGLIERRSDPSDRRAKRLFLTPAAKPVMERLSVVSEKMMANVLAGLDQRERKAMVASLTTIKNNLREAIQNRMEAEFSDRAELEQRYG
jgi:MarR family transcriptional regulator for hemolysin